MDQHHDQVSGVIDLDVISSADVDDDPPGRPWPRRRAIVLTTVAVLVVALGCAGYAWTVPTPTEALPASTPSVIYYADGQTVLARLDGSAPARVSARSLPVHVTDAVLAAEDPRYRDGSLRRGPSAISRGYARLALGRSAGSAARVLVAAAKLEARHDRDTILDLYLNRVDLGRGAYGVEAGAQAYFGKPASALTVAEAIALAGMIRSPGDGAYDPTRHPAQAERRWREVRANMVDPLHALDATTAASLEYPTDVRRFDPDALTTAAVPPGNTGILVRHILSELSRDPAFKRPLPNGLGAGGYRIVSTIDAGRQRLAEKYAGLADPAAPRHGQPADVRTAMVAVEPRTGRVVAFYGGDADGQDYAGMYYDDRSGQLTGFGRHPPGGSFAPYDLAAALRAGVSVRSTWDAHPRRDFPEYGRSGPMAVTDVRSCPTRGDTCTLAESVQAGLNVPLFGLTATIGPTAVVDMARRAGVDALWTDDLRRVELRDPVRAEFGPDVGIGRYPLTVVDHANGMATFAARGQRARAHFVASVFRGGTEVYRENPAVQDIGLSRPQLDDLTWTLAQHKTGGLGDGRRSAAVSGTWALGRPTDVAHSWTAGYTWQLATAVWVGNGVSERPLRDAAALPGVIYQRFMAEATAGTPPMQIPAPAYGGDAKAGNAR